MRYLLLVGAMLCSSMAHGAPTYVDDVAEIK